MIERWHKSRLLNLLFWIVPPVFLIWLFQEGLDCWFIDDDFAWLSLIRQLARPHGLLLSLFEPAAQGTIRPWSERGFFLLFESLFGMDALPFRIAAFATMAVDLLLLNWVTRRLTGSRFAGFVAATCWAANTVLMTVMTWSSAYNEAMCAGFLLGALALLIRFAETGRPIYWWLQAGLFVLGLGALEINVVYPALAAAYALFAAPSSGERGDVRRRLLWRTAPLFVISVVYFVVHMAFAPVPKAGPYAVHFDLRALRALLLYGKWSILPVDWQSFGHSRSLGKLILWVQIVGIGGLFLLEWRRRRTTALFFLCWYLAALAPVLVLPDHHSDYYLTIPSLGLAMLFGFGVTCGVREYRSLRWAALVPVALYLTGMIPISRAATHWALLKTEPVRSLVLGVVAAREKHPGKAIVLQGIPASVYNDSMAQGAFYPLGITDVYLTPGSAVTSGPDIADPEKAVLDPDVMAHALINDQVVIYSLSGDHLRNVTNEYERSAPNLLSDRLPVRIDAGNPLYSWLLGPMWLQPESGVRWMPGFATLRLRGPEKNGSKLLFDGFYPAEQLGTSPRYLSVAVDGVPLGEARINNPESDFHRLFQVPDSEVGKKSIEVAIRIRPAERRGGQEYGAVFGKITLLP